MDLSLEQEAPFRQTFRSGPFLQARLPSSSAVVAQKLAIWAPREASGGPENVSNGMALLIRIVSGYIFGKVPAGGIGSWFYVRRV